MSKVIRFAGFLVGLTFLASPAASQLPNPMASETQNARNNPCADPWVSLAVSKVKGSRAAGSGNMGECDIKLYGGGQWGSYDELVRHVRSTRSELAAQNIQFGLRNGEPALLMIDPKKGISASALVAAGGGNLVAAGGGNLVAAGGGNLVAAGGGNLVAAGGGNIIAAGGGNYSLLGTQGFKLVFKLPGGRQLRVR
jgi:hypothetical protein